MVSPQKSMMRCTAKYTDSNRQYCLVHEFLSSVACTAPGSISPFSTPSSEQEGAANTWAAALHSSPFLLQSWRQAVVKQPKPWEEPKVRLLLAERFQFKTYSQFMSKNT